ncbi:mannose-1-phosphate guanylyltransferase [Candidatus Peregrinibacteria bacterium CG_4_10_14_0_2_um_filter_38_24]|nr:MAG: mannose-1-phosphate guanylyltransferase [Candidatus Peregrinibacteria bacterium CG_4_10_14_0_2_um_filter_38_24]PJC39088.1 MAG: mannose-1-phosphate guanylyltransferase [Candidatus Peregrinibacteria bacterium CG_4_9_14_0_2_um_filter_38_9]
MKAVILAGGGGTRLWPLSVEESPKQFQKLVSEKTLIEETLDRLSFLDPKDIYIATNKTHKPLVQKICTKVPEENIIIEPALRDTASCIGLAAAIIEKKHPGEVMAVIYADHLIKNKAEFEEKLRIAESLAKEEHTLNIIEVKASEPNTNYGYVKLGALQKKEKDTEIYILDSFKEKPTLEQAETFIKEGNYLWNTGIYVWESSTILHYYKEYKPETYEKLQKIAENFGTQAYENTLESIYPTLEKISIDYAIMENVDPKNVRILKSDLGWSDIGNFETIWAVQGKDAQSNVKRGEVATLDTKNSLIYNDTDKKMAVIGLKDVVIVNTKDGILICDKSQCQRIKELT